MIKVAPATALSDATHKETNFSYENTKAEEIFPPATIFFPERECCGGHIRL